MAAKQKSSAKKKAAAKSIAQKSPTKSKIMAFIADDTGLSKKEVSAVFDSLGSLMKKSLGSRGLGLFTVPGLVKVKVIKKSATKARKGINPFTGEQTVFKAKPARKVVKALPLKGLKDMV